MVARHVAESVGFEKARQISADDEGARRLGQMLPGIAFIVVVVVDKIGNI